MGSAAGKYAGVYYTKYSSGSINLADAWLPDFSGRVEKDTLNEALATFTEGDEGTYVGQYGIYLK
jgi:hypothetical protein